MLMSEAEEIARFLTDGDEALKKMRENGRSTALGFSAPVALFESPDYDYATAVEVFRGLGFKVFAGGEHDGETLHHVELPPAWTICLDGEYSAFIASYIVEPHGVGLLRRGDVMGPFEEGWPVCLCAWRRYELFQNTKSRRGIGVVGVMDRAKDDRLIRQWQFSFDPGEPCLQQALAENKALEPVKAEAWSWLKAKYPRWNDPTAYWPA